MKQVFLFFMLFVNACVPATRPAIAPSPTLTMSLPATPTPLPPTSAPPEVLEYPITVIPLEGPLEKPKAEISGLAWYGDTLILLPQYPDKFDDVVFTLTRSEIQAFLAEETAGPLTPQTLPFLAPDFEELLDGYEGFEAIGFAGDRAFPTIETETDDAEIGYLVTGNLAADLSELCIDAAFLTEIPHQGGSLKNMTEEALLLADGYVITLHETNGAAINPAPLAHRFTQETLARADAISFPTIEYRITDATALDTRGHFWAINYFFPGDAEQIDPAPDSLAEEYGEGPTPTRFTTVERLVEFQYTDKGILRTATPPIQLQLIDDDHSRNWEGLARLEGQGFLIVTDKHPETILGFVAYTE